MSDEPRPDFALRLRGLAPSPGVYIMKNARGDVIYVGKAAKLRDRVRSYFQDPGGHIKRTRELVSNIADFEVIRTDTPTEALILENELIKRYQPKYNVMLKDSKTYPYLKITNEEWPIVELTRRILDDGGRYYGPYTNAGKAYKVLKTIERLFPYRKCGLHTFRSQRASGRACFYRDIHQCTAPCVDDVDRPTYMRAIEDVQLFLSGHAENVVPPIEEEMTQASDAWNFERAVVLRDRLRAIEHVLEEQKIVGQTGTSVDIIAVAQGPGGDAGVQVGFVRNGKLLGSEFFPMQAWIEDTPVEITSSFIGQFYAEAAMVPPALWLQHPVLADEAELLSEWLATRRGGRVDLIAPKRGDKRHLVEMVAKSAAENLEQSRLKFLSDEQRTIGALSELASALDAPRMPLRIECFDISHSQGTNTVASMVVFEEGRPAKKEYRRFTIKTVEGNNDFASMAEVISRRFRRAADAENGSEDADSAKWTTLPDLVIIDGGKGQLNAALKALSEVGWTDQPIVGLAKENEELFLPNQPDPVVLPRDSQALYLIQRIRDEAHRFAVTFHRERRSKAAVHSKLDDIPGIGPKKRQALLKKFGSVKAIREASEADLLAVPGISASLAAQIKAGL